MCDVNAKILAVNARYPGSVHDAAIWYMSGIRQALHRNFLQGDETTYLIGDSGYPLLPYLLTPIIGAQPGTPQGRYTQMHSQIRNCIERTNGLLKGIWRCLSPDRVLHYRPDFAARIVYACAVLHNIIREMNLPGKSSSSYVLVFGMNLLFFCQCKFYTAVFCLPVALCL